MTGTTINPYFYKNLILQEMSAFTRLKEFFVRRVGRSDMDPEPAYDLWSEQYDNQPGNLILSLDRELFSILIKGLDFRLA